MGQSVTIQDKTNANAANVDSSGALKTVAVSTGYGAATPITRTNDTNAYAANDVIGAAVGATAAISFTLAPAAGETLITSAQFEIDISSIPSGMTSFLLYLYNIAPPSALGDNAAWDLPAGDRAAFLGVVSLGTPIDLGSTLYVEQNGINKQITTASAAVFGYLVTVGPWTPAALTVFKVTLHTVAL